MCLFPILILIIQSLCFPVSQAHSKTISLPWKMTALFLSLLYLCMSSMTEVLKEKLPLTIKLFLLLCSFMACYLLLLRIGNFSPKKTILPVTFRKIGKSLSPGYPANTPLALCQSICGVSFGKIHFHPVRRYSVYAIQCDFYLQLPRTWKYRKRHSVEHCSVFILPVPL